MRGAAARGRGTQGDGEGQPQLRSARARDHGRASEREEGEGDAVAVVPFGNPVDATGRTTETGREEEAGGASTGAVMSREPATARVPRARARRRGRRDGAAERVRGEAEEKNGGSHGE